MIITAFLVFVFIIISAVIFFAGVYVGNYGAGKRLADCTERTLEKSNLSNEQKLDFLDALQEVLEEM